MKLESLTLEENETVLLQVRKHWFVLCIQVLSILILALLPIPFYVFTSMSETLSALVPLNGPFAIALYTCWLILQWMALFNIWTNYYLDVWTVTDKRLIAVDQHGFFSRTIASFRLERMQDITVDIHGIIATFLDYGTLEIQTAGEEEKFLVTGMPNPSAIKSTVLQATGKLIYSPQSQPHSEV